MREAVIPGWYRVCNFYVLDHIHYLYFISKIQIPYTHCFHGASLPYLGIRLASCLNMANEDIPTSEIEELGNLGHVLVIFQSVNLIIVLLLENSDQGAVKNIFYYFI